MIANDFPASCDIYSPAEGTVYFGAWGNPDSETGASGGNYQLMATIVTNTPVGPAALVQTDPALQTIANRYLKHLRGATITASSDTYPESGIVKVQKGDDYYYFYFGTDASTAVLSVDHNGTWTHFHSWDEFEKTLANNAD